MLTRRSAIALIGLGFVVQPVLAATQSAFDFTFFDIDGNAMPLAKYRGKALLIVNTASKCDFTPQLKGLEALYESYKERGLVVIGVPSDSFGQEPDNASTIKSFAAEEYGVTFPMTEKTVVTGAKAHPFYRWAKLQLGPLAEPKWNFTKYIVAPNGKLVTWFDTETTPQDPKLLKALEGVLPVKAGVAAKS